MTLKELCKQSHKIAVEKGFWGCQNHSAFKKCEVVNNNSCIGCSENFKERNDGELIALMHSELSEGLDALRQNNPPSEHIPKFTSIEEEMADLIIRVGDFCEARHIRLEEAIKAKMKFNQKRPYKHNKEF